MHPEAAWRPSPLEPPVYAQCGVSMVSSRHERTLHHRLGSKRRPSARSTCHESQILVSSWGRQGKAAYNDDYFSFEGEEALEVLELRLGFCFGGHDARCQLKSKAVSHNWVIVVVHFKIHTLLLFYCIAGGSIEVLIVGRGTSTP